MKKFLQRLWVKHVIRQLKKSPVNSEKAARILIHYTLVEMEKRGAKELEIEYEAPDSGFTKKLMIIAYLTDK